MIEPLILYPPRLFGKELDDFLSIGFYRMGQGIFSTHYLIVNDQVHEVNWLRYHIPGFIFSKSANKINRINRQFSTSIKPLLITDEIETLYSLYKTAIDFDPAISVSSWLMEEQDINVYDTRMMEVRDGSRLIAVGIFDKGESSIAGIMNFYDPAYKKYSLGKYLMLQKVKYASDENMEWYYPGYIVIGYPKFDYKLFMGHTFASIYQPGKNAWIPYVPNIYNTGM
ncbi:MAG: GNAT family N-acetyltransferase [Ferruginibacter sp.]